jgi:hypothetical protein
VSPTPRRPPKPKPVKPWQRAEPGRYRSSDERFALESDGGGRWFVTDSQEHDELGMARTSGPFATLEAAKAAADATRERPVTTSPLASRIADAARRPRRERGSPPETPRSRAAPKASASAGTAAERRPATPMLDAGRAASGPAASGPAASRSAASRRPWIEELAERDAPAAKSAGQLIALLEREGIAGADALVRRDLLGDRPAVAARLLAREIIAAIGALREPTALAIVEAIAQVLATSRTRAGLPGWDLIERDAAGERRRSIRLTGVDLAAAAEDRKPDRG